MTLLNLATEEPIDSQGRVAAALLLLLCLVIIFILLNGGGFKK